MEERVMWGEGTPWKTEAAWWAYVRGGLRKGLWKSSPIKLEFKKSQRYKAPIGVGGRGVWAITCNICGAVEKESKSQVDHKQGEVSLKCEEDILPFVKHLAFVTEDMLQCLCKTCHDTKTYQERYRVTWEEAVKRKKEIKREKERKEAKKAAKKKQKKGRKK